MQSAANKDNVECSASQSVLFLTNTLYEELISLSSELQSVNLAQSQLTFLYGIQKLLSFDG